MTEGWNIVPVGFKDHNDEFQLMFWPPNSLDLRPTEHIWDAMEWQFRAQTPSYRNISSLCSRYSDIWYKLSPVMYQEYVESMAKRIGAVLQTKITQHFIELVVIIF